MRFVPALLMVAIVALSLYAVDRVSQSSSPTGLAAGSFSSSATVSDVEFNTSSVTFAPVPVANADPINATMGITYEGEGVVTLTAAKPAGYEQTTNWRIREATQTKDAEDLGDNIRWDANLSARTAEAFIVIPAPFLSVDFVNDSGLEYTQQVRVGSEVHLTGVHANTQVSPVFRNYRIYEIDRGTQDVTAQYEFSVNGTTATWHGFNLSTKTFRIIGVRDSVPAQETQTAQTTTSRSKRGLTVWTSSPNGTATPEAVLSTSLDWLDVLLAPGEERNLSITIGNDGNATGDVTLESTASFIRPEQTRTSIPPGESVTVGIVVGPIGTTERQGRLIIRSGAGTQTIFISLEPLISQEGAATPAQEQPAAITEPPVASPSGASSAPHRKAGTIMLVALALFGLLAWAIYARDRLMDKGQ